jgi:hypothetical protein
LLCYLNLFASVTRCLSYVVLFGCNPCMHECLLGVCFISFPALESNDDCQEEGEVFEYQEEGDQGQAHQGKPSTCAYLNPIMSLCIVLLLSLFLCIVFILLCLLYSNSWRLSSTSWIIIISKDDTIWYLLNTLKSRDSMISIEVFGKHL